MAVTTYIGRSRRALLHKDNSTYWVAIGRTTAWEDENVPPAETPGATDIEEAICFVQPQLASLCRPVNENGDFTHLGQQYAYVADEDALVEDGRFLYILAKFDPTEGQPYGEFRQTGIFCNLVPVAGYEQAQWLAPANVADRGVLEYLDNDVKTTMAQNRQEVIEIVIEFR